jgi:hypothetical protein
MKDERNQLPDPAAPSVAPPADAWGRHPSPRGRKDIGEGHKSHDNIVER